MTLFGFGNRGNVLSARASAEYFARRNGIAGAPAQQKIKQPRSAGPTFADRTTWRSAGGAEVVLYTIHGGGHSVPQPYVRARRLLGRTHRGLDGPVEIWRFFARQGPRPAEGTESRRESKSGEGPIRRR